MTGDDDDRFVTIEQVTQLLSAVQVMARKLANESHGRTYDRVQELNQILHRARMQLNLIEADSNLVPLHAEERRKTPRTESPYPGLLES